MLRPLMITCAALLLSHGRTLVAATIHVPTDQPTIAAGLAASIAGDTVEIACGTYFESALVVSSGIVLRSATGLPDCVTIDGSLGNPLAQGIIECPGDATTMLEGLSLSNGYNELSGGALNCAGSPTVRNSVFNNNFALEGAGAVWIGPLGSPEFIDCTFTGNRSGDAGALWITGGEVTFTRCAFVNNVAQIAHGGAIWGSGTFLDCTFIGNYAKGNGGAIKGNNVTLVGCLFARNFVVGDLTARTGGAVDAGVLNATGCTFYFNDIYPTQQGPPFGSTVCAGSGVISNCLIVGFECYDLCGSVVEGGPGLIIECTNIFDPIDNGWGGAIGSQLGINGNMSVDPLFCDPQNDDFTLSSLSPCLDTACGTMGAFGLGCLDEKPGIVSVTDVDNDQGRQVRLTWYRSQYDAPASGVDITGYAIYREQGAFAAAAAASSASAQSARGEGYAIPGWDYILTIPNRGDSTYQVVVPTLCDSTLTDGGCLSTFMVSALTTSPFTFYDSPAKSGYSKDNLAPPTPTNFAVSYNTGAGNQLIWDAVAANDFAVFRVYRGDSPDFAPSAGTLVATTTQTTWTDPSYDGWDVFYGVVSVDAAGNESAPASAGLVTGVDSPPAARVLSLGPNVPNPFNPSTRIPFVLPSAGRARMMIYDVAGHRVRSLVDRDYPAGTHEAEWNGTTDAGTRVGSGVYVVRLEFGGSVQNAKMVVLK